MKDAHGPNSSRRRLVVAAIVALAGIGVAWRALDRSSRAPIDPGGRVAPALAAALESADYVTVRTLEQVDQLVAGAAAAVQSSAAALSVSEHGLDLTREQEADLASALRARLRAVIDGDLETNIVDLVARGDRSAWDEAQRTQWEASADWHRHAPIDPAGVELRMRYVQGRPVGPGGLAEAASVLTLKPAEGRFPIPADPVGAKLDVVEIRFLMRIRDIQSQAPVAAAVGFGFAWSRERRQWIPWEVRVLKADTEHVLGAPVF